MFNQNFIRMNYLIKKRTGLTVLLFMFFYGSIICCNNQASTNQLTIPSLKPIEQTPKAHYQTLSKYSPDVNPKLEHLDIISFPEKANQLIIKIISPSYLSRKEIDMFVKQLEPPANSSEQTKAELDFLLDLQANRSPEQIKEALRMHDIGYFPLIGMRNEKDLFFEAYEILGAEFNRSAYPKTKHLLHQIMKEMRITEFSAKNYFLRARPRQLESKLQPLKQMKSSSFASGHTLWAYMQAYIMGELIPEKRQAFLDLAYQIGYSREIIGVHYPSDEEASRKLAHQLLKQMWEKPAFIKDFHLAQLEWQQAN